MVAEDLAPPLLNIINSCIDQRSFPAAWKMSRICPIPKTNTLTCENDLRPISVLPVLAKVYERLVFHQLAQHIDENSSLYDSISACRKGQSTVTVLQAIHDDILRAMKRGEVTMMVLADFSKAFDTVRFGKLITKMNKLGLSKTFLILMLNYVSNRRQFVQIDDNQSEVVDVKFGVPQGSILGPVLFNIYVSDLQDQMNAKCYQYADDTTVYRHSKVSDLYSCQAIMASDMQHMGLWSQANSLTLNGLKTKIMLLSTAQLARKHNLDSVPLVVSVNNFKVERVECYKLLGIHFDQHLRWGEHVKNITASCYATIAVLRKLKHLAPYNLLKTLAESLVLSVGYGDTVFYPLTNVDLKRLQKCQNTAASFVLGKYVKDREDLEKIGWLPMKERRDLHLLQQTFKAIHFANWPQHLGLEQYVNDRNLRSQGNIRLHSGQCLKTF